MNLPKTIVVGVSGGIAAYKALDVVSTFKKKGIDVHVIMTKSAEEFVTPLSFQSLSQNFVVQNMFQEPKAWEIQHISLAKKADLLLVVPATANIIGKVANGIADDMLSTTIMATKAPVMFAPAMNTNMYNNPIVKENIERLKNLGYKFISPVSGRLACGDVGDGKLPDPKYICEYALSQLYEKKDLIGKKVLVTAGPTIAQIDPVRFITNRSTGKMGYAIAEECRDRGAEVILITGPNNLPDPFGMEIIKVSTTEEMLNAALMHFKDSDIVIKSAAVADYKPVQYSKEKIKKSSQNLTLNLIKDIDILKTLGENKKNQVLIGFAAESSDLLNNAAEKLDNKNLDYIVANDISSSEIGFASEDNAVTVLGKDGSKVHFEKASKREIAGRLLDLIAAK